MLLGTVVFLNIGFILSAWARSPAAASGMGNAVALPMMFLAGTFFSTASLPWLLPYAAMVLPLTPMLDALREVAINSTPLWETWPQLAAPRCVGSGHRADCSAGIPLHVVRQSFELLAPVSNARTGYNRGHFQRSLL